MCHSLRPGSQIVEVMLTGSVEDGDTGSGSVGYGDGRLQVSSTTLRQSDIEFSFLDFKFHILIEDHIKN